MGEINFNYRQAINQAGQLDANARELRNLANGRVQKSIESVAVSWQGEAAQQFLSYCTQMQENIRTEAKRLEDIASSIRRAAEAIRDAEERARALMENQSASRGGGGTSW
jgi:WXG100 family type VII secretion target